MVMMMIISDVYNGSGGGDNDDDGDYDVDYV